MRVGTIVKINCASAINGVGELGVCYENSELGCSLIFQKGGYDGFSQEDIESFGVRSVGHCTELEGYKFSNVIRLSEDFTSGLFSPAFIQGGRLLGAETVIPIPNKSLRGLSMPRRVNRD